MTRIPKKRGPRVKYTPDMRALRRVWTNMLDRCNNKNSPAYRYYGGRGITVCERWLSIATFTADMSPRPVGATLDRIDNDKGYAPDNCRWATWVEQHNNRRSNLTVEHEGKTWTLTTLCRHLDLPFKRVYSKYTTTGDMEGAIAWAKSTPPAT